MRRLIAGNRHAMRRYLLLAWVITGLAAGAMLHLLLGRPEPAAWIWSATALPVAAHVGLGLVRSVLGGRIGVDAVALAAILGAVALEEAAAAAVIGLMVAGGEALEAWAEGRATRALTDLVARAPRRAARIAGRRRSRRSTSPPSAPATCCWSAPARPSPPTACWRTRPRPSTKAR